MANLYVSIDVGNDEILKTLEEVIERAKETQRTAEKLMFMLKASPSEEGNISERQKNE